MRKLSFYGIGRLSTLKQKASLKQHSRWNNSFMVVLWLLLAIVCRNIFLFCAPGVNKRKFDHFIDQFDHHVDRIDQIFDRLNKGDRYAHMPIWTMSNLLSGSNSVNTPLAMLLTSTQKLLDRGITAWCAQYSGSLWCGVNEIIVTCIDIWRLVKVRISPSPASSAAAAAWNSEFKYLSLGLNDGGQSRTRWPAMVRTAARIASIVPNP